MSEVASTVTADQPVRVRAAFGAAVVQGASAPFDRVQIRVYYPAADPVADALDSGMALPHPRFASLPVVIVAGGLNCGLEAYGWLAHHLAQQGFCAVTYAYTGPISYSYLDPAAPPMLALIPDDGVAGPDSTGSVTRAVLTAVRDVFARPPLAGGVRVDLEKVAVVGHSAGGRTALYLSQNQDLALSAVAVYAAHALMRSEDGGPVAPPISAGCPVLIISGGADGVIAQSRTRYGASTVDGWDPAAATFDALEGGHGDHLLIQLPQASHFSITERPDTALGRAFLEEGDRSPERHRALIAAVITAFLDCHLRGAGEATLADTLRGNQLIAHSR